MKILPPIIALLALLTFSALPVFGQKLVCACESQKGNGRPCSEVKCSDGCTSFCGPNFTCFSACRKGGLEERFTIKLEKQSGKDIASALTAQTGYKIEFEPYEKYRSQVYDLNMKNDDIFNALNFLYKRGAVTIDGVPFLDFKKNRAKEKDNRHIH